MTANTPFSSMPTLPVVPLPAPGEALGGWISAIAELYGVSMADYVGRLGVPRHWITAAIERDLVFRPLPRVMEQLQLDTGIAPERLRSMTFAGLDPELEDACQHHDAACADCAYEVSDQAGRPVRLLFARAAWRIICPRHPPDLKPGELTVRGALPAFYDRLRAVIAFLDRAAFDRLAFVEFFGPRLATAFSVDVVLRFVYQLNTFFHVEVTDVSLMSERPEFRILRAFVRNEDDEPLPLPEEERNSLAVSLMLAWHFVEDPFPNLFARLRTTNPVGRKTGQDVEQFRALMQILLEIWPAEMLTMPVLRYATAPVGWNDDQGPTALAHAVTKSWNNDPSHPERLAEAHWNHRAWNGSLLSPCLRDRHPHRYSLFPDAGPFTYRHVASKTRPASQVSQKRHDVWEQRIRARHTGLQRFLDDLPKRSKRQPADAKAPTRQPARLVKPEVHVVEAVRTVLEAHGPMPTKLSPRDRRTLHRKLFAAAVKHLEKRAWQRGQ